MQVLVIETPQFGRVSEIAYGIQTVVHASDVHVVLWDSERRLRTGKELVPLSIFCRGWLQVVD